jgi:hypothetical protein
MFAPTFVQACRRRSSGPYPTPAGGMGVGAACRAEREFMSHEEVRIHDLYRKVFADGFLRSAPHPSP